MYYKFCFLFLVFIQLVEGNSIPKSDDFAGIRQLDNLLVAQKENDSIETNNHIDANNKRSDIDKVSSLSDTFEDQISQNHYLRTDIKNWALRFNINHSALKAIIQILNERLGKTVLPQDPRTLMETPITVETIPVGDGQYWHNGLQFNLEKIFSKISGSINISLNINIDGLPIFKSSKDEFWPILANIAEFPKQKPMVVGIYCGKSKPSDLNSYLMPFVEELKTILSCGVFVNGHKISVKIRCFILDSPARAFIKAASYKKSLLELLLEIQKRMHMEIPSLGLPILDPLDLQMEIPLDYTNPDLGTLSATFAKLTIAGLQGFILNDLNFDIAGYPVLLNMTIPEVNIKGFYDIDGILGDLLTVFGAGPMSATISNIQIYVKGRLRYLDDLFTVRELEAIFSIGDLKVNFKGLYGGNNEWEDFINLAVSELGARVLDELYPGIQPELTSWLIKQADEILSGILIGDLLKILVGEIELPKLP